MPKYVFQCPICGSTEEVVADTGSDAEIPECCGQQMKRQWTTSFQLKGSGWTWRPNDEIPTEDLPPSKRGKDD